MDNSKMLTFILSFSCLVIIQATEVTFNITSVEGSVKQVTYTRQSASECIYEQKKDILTCMKEHSYSDVISVWKDHMTQLRYISVNCLYQNDVVDIKGMCFCKTASSRPPVNSAQVEKYYGCQLKSTFAGMFNKTNNLELLDLSANQITKVERKSFEGLLNLKYLFLRRNNIRVLPFGMLCDVTNLEFVDMSELMLDVFPSHVFKCKQLLNKITVVDLSHTGLEDVPADSLDNLPSLESLNLAGNRLRVISKRSFSGGTSLQHLNLSHNDLDYLFPHFCDYLPNMTNLHLHDNHFANFSFEEVETCTAVVNLDLSTNRIRTFGGNASALTALQNLNISSNRITSLNISFQGLTNLETLDISKNNISRFNSDQFNGLAFLKYLDVSYNDLDFSSNFKELFDPLKQIQQLYITNGKLRSIPSNSFHQMQNLTDLLLSNNLLNNLSSDAFAGLTSLERLSLDFNEITILPRGLFDSLMSLKYLSLSFNKISSIEVKFEQSFRSLFLDNNNISTLPAEMNYLAMEHFNISHNNIGSLVGEGSNQYINLNRMLDIDLSFNNFDAIPSAILATCTRLNILTMEGNRITGNLTAENFSKLGNLTVLNLANNDVESINGVFSNSSLQQLLSLNVSGNPMKEIEQLSHSTSKASVITIDMSKCNITRLSGSSFTGLTKLETVYLSDNNIETFPPFLADDDTRYILAGNPVVCDCNMSWLSDRFAVVDNVKIATQNFVCPECKVYTQDALYSPAHLLKKQFMCPETEGCDAHCACFKTESSGDIETIVCRQSLTSVPSVVSKTASSLYLDGNRFSSNSSLNPLIQLKNMSTKELFLNSSSIRFIDFRTFHGFVSLEILDLGNNLLETLPGGIFENKKWLIELFLGDNLLRFIESNVFDGLPSLKELDISGNNLALLLPETLLELSSLNAIQHFRLSRNSWACNCTNVDFKDFVEKFKFKILDQETLVCDDTSLQIIITPRSSFSCLVTSQAGHGSPAMAIGIIIAVLLVLIISASVVYFRRELLSLLYSKTGCHIPGKRHYPGMHFDGFISYDPSDQHCSTYVQRELMPKLTNNAYNVQTSIDLIPDIEVTKKAIEDSRCSVFIVNKNFSSNPFFLKVFRSAVERHKIDNRHNIVLVIHGDIDLQTLEPEVMKRLRKGDYISSRSRLWWERLMYELPKPSGFHDNVSDSDVVVFSSLTANSQYDSIM